MYNLVNKPKKVKYIKSKKGDIRVTHSDISKAKKILNYYPKINIDEGLQKTYNWQIKIGEYKNLD